MTVPVVAFFNNIGGVGKTTFVYHIAWMLNELGRSVAVLDLDPQANLTASFVDERRIEELWFGAPRRTVYGAVAPLFEGSGDLADPHVEEIESGLGLVPGDVLLSGAEQDLSDAWASSLSGDVRAFQMTTAFSIVAQRAAAQMDAEIVLMDAGPNLGAINRAASVASDHVVLPLRPDLYSLQGLRNLGPTLRRWRRDWTDRAAGAPCSDLYLSSGRMRARGYAVLRHGLRVDRAVGPYDRWLRQIPTEYRSSVLDEPVDEAPIVAEDEYCLGLIKYYYSLASLAQEARKPIFLLSSAEGAIGSYQPAVQDAYGHFESLTRRLLSVLDLEVPA
jgi:cellulose biosynthesis protein BcsQ